MTQTPSLSLSLSLSLSSGAPAELTVDASKIRRVIYFQCFGFVFSAGDACGYGGTCDQSYRIDWVLVTTPSGDTFVPTSVPNHCTCVYS